MSDSGSAGSSAMRSPGMPIGHGAPAPRPRRRRRTAAEQRPDSLFRAESACLLGAVVVALLGMPIAMGGRHPIGHVVLTAAALAAVAAWVCRVWRHGTAVWKAGVVEGFLVIAIGIGLFQVVPLPEGLVRAVSPRLYQLLPCLDGGNGSLWRWDRLSLAPGETLTGLGILLAQGVFLAVLVQRTRSIRDVESVLVVVAWATVLMAALGLAQYLGGNGRYLWFYEFAYNDAGGVVKGTFTNRNHFAGFLAIGSGAVLWLGLGWPDGSRDPSSLRPGRLDTAAFGWLLVAVVGFATLSSLSRGGCLALAVAVLVSLACETRSRAWRLSTLMAFAAAVTLLAVALAIHGWDRIGHRFEALFDQRHGDLSGGRGAVWQAACRAVGDFPWLGTGVGSHAQVSPLYMPPTDGILYTHAENSYLNLGVESGCIGLIVAIAAVVVGLAASAVVAVRGDDRERRAAAAIAAGLSAIAIHGFVDFVWFVPACSMLAMTLGCCAVALAAGRVRWLPSLALPLGRTGGLIAATAMAVLLVGNGMRQYAAARAETAWERSIKEGRALAAAAAKMPPADAAAPAGDASRAEGAAPDSAPTPAAAATYTAGVVPEADAPGREIAEALAHRIASLEKTVALRPDHPRAWAELALARLDHFGLTRNLAGSSMGVVDLRLSAMRGGFASPEELQGWLRRAAGAGYGDLELALRDALEAIQVAPLSGEAWCALGHLGFVRGRMDLATRCTAQALRVRPASSLVLFEAANQALIEGQVDEAARLWRASFAADLRQRNRILALLVPRIPSADACRLLEPDLEGLRAIDSAWARREAAADLAEVRTRRLAAVLERAAASDPQDRCRLLIEAATVEQKLGHPVEAQARLEAATTADPASYQAHRALADAAVAAADWKTAQRELEWCLLRRPDSTNLKEILEKVRASQNRRTAAPGPSAKNLSGKLQKL